MRLNRRLLPIKAHYFFFMAALGPMLPQMNVFGRQLGISPVVMGLVTAVLPVLFMIAKPTVGFLVDYFQNQRKAIFLTIIMTMCGSFALLHFLPSPSDHQIPNAADGYNVTGDICALHQCNLNQTTAEAHCTNTRAVRCRLICPTDTNVTNNILLSAMLYRKDTHAQNQTNEEQFEICSVSNLNNTDLSCVQDGDTACHYSCASDIDSEVDCLYGTFTFWGFVILMSMGTIAFNVVNCLSDAICFDVLGDGQEMAYGKQRVWGTVGYGLTALLAGFAVDIYSRGAVKSYTPAILLMIIFTAVDLLSCVKLKLPVMHAPESIAKEVWKLLKQKHIFVFICFATMAGVMDSFIIYYMFWYMEELAAVTGHLENIKLLEGLTIAAESFGGEVLFFLVSGKILSRIGYGHCLTLCFGCYALRLGLISLVPNPWWVLPIELVMQGPTYALCYTTIVAYASAVAPKGASSTVQGIVAGMDDGFGFALGSLSGGFMYRWLGGARSFQVFACVALLCSVTHCALYFAMLEGTIAHPQDPKKNRGEYKKPEMALEDKTDHDNHT